MRIVYKIGYKWRGMVSLINETSNPTADQSWAMSRVAKQLLKRLSSAMCTSFQNVKFYHLILDGHKDKSVKGENDLGLRERETRPLINIFSSDAETNRDCETSPWLCND